ncbi:uncharacterized protein PG998_002905 [Apiospora kogelbergensis]|uniref:uncharacterized protein n=1 Tax=Apiospora kogelbergensis TaxID=1337665 RepID=UPI0031327185
MSPSGSRRWQNAASFVTLPSPSIKRSWRDLSAQTLFQRHPRHPRITIALHSSIASPANRFEQLHDGGRRERADDGRGGAAAARHAQRLDPLVVDSDGEDDDALLARAKAASRNKRRARRHLEAQEELSDRRMAAMEANWDKIVDEHRAGTLRAKLDELSQARFDQALVIVSAHLADPGPWQNMSAEVTRIAKRLRDQQLEAEIEAQKAEVKRLSADMGKRSKRSEQLWAQFTEQVDQIDEQSKQIKNQEAQSKKDQDQLETKRDQVKALADRINNLEGHLKDRVDQVGQLERERDRLKAAKNSQGIRLRERAGRLADQATQLQNQATQLQEKAAQVQELESKVQELESKVQTLEGKVDSRRSEKEVLEDSVASLQRAAKDHELLLGDERALADQLGKELTTCKRRSSKRRGRIGRIQQKVEALQRELEYKRLLVKVRDRAIETTRASLTARIQAEAHRADLAEDNAGRAEDCLEVAVQEIARLEGEIDSGDEELEDTLEDMWIMEGDGALLLCRLRDLEAAHAEQDQLLRDAASSQMQLDRDLDAAQQALEVEFRSRWQLADEQEQERQRVLAARRRTARLVADQSGCTAVADDEWLPVLHAMGQEQQPLDAADQARSWTIRGVLTSALTALCRLHGLRLDGRLDGTAVQLLERLRVILGTPARQPLALFAVVLGGFRHVGCSEQDAACVLGAWKLAGLLASVRPADADLSQVRDALENRLASTPLGLLLRGVVQVDEVPLGLLALPPRVQPGAMGSRRLYFPEQGKVVCLDGAQGRWLVLVDLGDHSVRLVHRQLARISLTSLVFRGESLSWPSDDLQVFKFVKACTGARLR